MEIKWFLILKNNRLFIVLFSFIYIVLASSRSFANTMIDYQGQIDFIKNQFDLVLDMEGESSAEIQIKKTAEENYNFVVDMKHIQTQFCDVSTKLSGSLVYNSDIISGKIFSQYTLIDYKPIEELKGLFEIKDKRFNLLSLSVEHIKSKGYIDFKSPYKLMFDINLFEITMKDFLKFWMNGNKMETEGLVSGDIKVSGDLQRKTLKGDLTSFNGHIEKLKYDSIHLHAEGIYPQIQVSHSKLSQTGGLIFSLDGSVDFSDKGNFIKQIKALKISPIVKDSDSSSEWTIRSSKDEAEVETKYFLRTEKETKASEDKGAGMLGIERKLSF